MKEKEAKLTQEINDGKRLGRLIPGCLRYHARENPMNILIERIFMLRFAAERTREKKTRNGNKTR